MFELHGVNHSGRVLLKGRVMRDQLLAVRRIPIDARLSSKPAREHSMDAQFRSARTSGEAYQPAILEAVCVSAKNDGNDAEAICTASRQPHIPFCSEEDLATGRAVHKVESSRHELSSMLFAVRPPHFLNRPCSRPDKDNYAPIRRNVVMTDDDIIHLIETFDFDAGPVAVGTT